MVNLKTKNSELIIDLNGGKINRLNLTGQAVLWGGLRPDGKKAATHVCLPNFRKVRSGLLAKLPQHGPARNDKWQLITNDPLVIKWTMDEIKGVYPAGLIARQEFKLYPQYLIYSLILKNLKDQVLSVNPGIHFYFLAGDKNQIKINSKKIDPNLWLADGSIYPIQSENVIEFSWGKISLKQEGFKQFMLWSPLEAEFVCIEPVNGVDNDIYKQENQLQPNQYRRWQVLLKLAQ